jgi:hypothetical protein
LAGAAVPGVGQKANAAIEIVRLSPCGVNTHSKGGAIFLEDAADSRRDACNKNLTTLLLTQKILNSIGEPHG